MDSRMETYKLILIGDSTVGKTNLLTQYVDGKNPDNDINTIGIEFKNKIITLKNGRKIKLQIWDTCGQEKFKSLTKNYFRCCSAGLFVFDVTNEDSFKNISKWLKLYKDINDENSKKILIGNKIDKKEKIVVKKERLEQYAKENDFKPFEISINDKTKIDKMFEEIVDLLIENKNGENNYINNNNIININNNIINIDNNNINNHYSNNKINHNSNNNNLNLNSNDKINRIQSKKLRQNKQPKKKKKGGGFC